MGGKQKLNSFEGLGAAITNNPEQGNVSYTSTNPDQGKRVTENPLKNIQMTSEDDYLSIQKEEKKPNDTNDLPNEVGPKKEGEDTDLKKSSPSARLTKNSPRTKSIGPRKQKGEEPLSSAHAGPESSFENYAATADVLEGGKLINISPKNPKEGTIHKSERKNNRNPVKIISVLNNDQRNEFFASRPKEIKSVPKKGFDQIPKKREGKKAEDINPAVLDKMLQVPPERESNLVKKARQFVNNIDKYSIQKPISPKELKMVWRNNQNTQENPKKETIVDKKTIADYLFKKITGKETFAVHGSQEKNGEIRPQTDLDGKLSVFLADYFGLKWNNTQFISPGDTPKNATVIFDSGYKQGATVELSGKEFQIFFDHHAKEKSTPPTSAANELLKTVELTKNHKEIPEWIKRFAYFTTEIDNFSYFNRADRAGNKIFTREYASKTWPETLYALYRYLPFSFIQERFERGISPLVPFNEEEKNISVRTPKGTTATIRELIQKIRKATNYSIKIVEKTPEKMFNSYILNEHPTLGRLLFVETTTDKKGKVSGQVQVKEMANMFGYDTLIQYSKETGSIYFSSQKDLNLIQEKLNKLGTIKGPIRGQQAFGKTSNTKDELLKLLEIDDSPEKRIERYTNEKEKLEEELKKTGNI